MANHKRGRPASRRAGCKMCKPYKSEKFSKPRARMEVAGRGGFGKIRKLIHTEQDLRDDCNPAAGDP